MTIDEFENKQKLGYILLIMYAKIYIAVKNA